MVSHSLMYSETYSLAAITTVQSCLDDLERTIFFFGKVDENLKQSIWRIRDVYAKFDNLEQEKGQVEYPHEKCDPAGMAIEIKFAAFSCFVMSR